MFENVNLKKVLEKERSVQREERQNATLTEFKRLFEADWENEKRRLNTIQQGSISSDLPSSENLPEERIFDHLSIKKLCVDYRLRFLSTKQFKGEIPRHALNEIKETEKRLGRNIDSFMIIAPSKMFRLEDANKDPLLFAPLSDGRFYLIDKWGNDLAWYRKWIALPVKTPANLLTTIVILSAVLAAFIPSSLLSTNGTGSYFSFMRLIAFGWNVIFILGISSYFWFASHAKFSVQAWNSKNFN